MTASAPERAKRTRSAHRTMAVKRSASRIARGLRMLTSCIERAAWRCTASTIAGWP